MSVVEQLRTAIQPISLHPGQACLFADLTQIPNSLEILSQIESEGYAIRICLQQYPEGLKAIAILRLEDNVTDDRYRDLTEEWSVLTGRFGDAIRLRYKPVESVSVSSSYPIQYSVHDWTIPGTPVWTETQGHLCPELEIPKPGETVVYVDYHMDVDDTLIQADVELAIDAMGYPAGSRWIGRNSLDVDNVVSYVGTVPSDQADMHLSKLSEVVPASVLVCVNG
jgi:hypothetical protein